MSKAFRLLALLFLAAAAIWLWRAFFPSPETVIRRRLQKLARAASFSSSDGALSKLAGARSVPDFFAPEVDLMLDLRGRDRRRLAGRDDIAQAALASRQEQGLSVKFPDINVAVNPDGASAMSDVTLDAHIAGERDDIVEELQISWLRTNDTWLIRKVQSVQPVSLQ